MMRIILDLDVCRGNAACVVAAPELFDYDEGTGQAVVLTASVGDSEIQPARMAAMHCPTRAITLEPRPTTVEGFED